MEASRWGGRVILLTVLSIILALVALSMVWFSVSVTRSYASPNTFLPGDQTFLFYSDHYVQGRTYTAYSEFWNLDTTSFADTIRVFVGWWIVAGLAFIAATVINSRSLSLITCGAALLMALVTVTIFVTSIGHSLPDVGLPVKTVDFWGTSSGVASDRSYSWTMTFNPTTGFFVLFLAMAIQTLAVSLRAYVVVWDIHHGVPEDEPESGQVEDSAEAARRSVDETFGAPRQQH